MRRDPCCPSRPCLRRANDIISFPNIISYSQSFVKSDADRLICREYFTSSYTVTYHLIDDEECCVPNLEGDICLALGRTRRCTNDLLLSYLFYRKEVLAPYWSNAFATQILGYETPEHNRLYA
jgi:hypothetical protein